MFLCELCLDRWRHWLRTLGLGIKRIGNINTQALFFFFLHYRCLVLMLCISLGVWMM